MAIEARDTTVAAGAAEIVTATAEDAETLSRGFAGVKGARVTARRLAEYWAALLDDYVGLFARRQRPNRIVEMTPRGRVLLDLFSEASRRGGSSGVASRLVRRHARRAGGRPAAARLRRARAGTVRAASRSPARGRARRRTAAPPRPIRVVIRAGDGALAGAMTSRAGSVATGIPLQDLSYDKGVIRFTITLGGASRRFEGALERRHAHGHRPRAGRPPGGSPCATSNERPLRARPAPRPPGRA